MKEHRYYRLAKKIGGCDVIGFDVVCGLSIL